MFDWVWEIFYFFGLWKKNAKIMMVGLDNAGKTTLTQILVRNQVKSPMPTTHCVGMEEFQVGNVVIQAFDIGGHASARHVWNTYFPSVSGIVFVVDSSDPDRFNESKKELDGLLSNRDISSVPVLVLGNKTDKRGAVSEDDLRLSLGLPHNLTTGKGDVELEGIRPIEVFMSSIVRKQGYGEGIKWLAQYL
eukprot:TRINITY_DN5857_c0_g1_i1.p2 TRINITY_DN5857_c0_g1~~TRINITY_DN5857_c0_g1_i1.p2  ORF type:complete len:211 (-),score=47.59 TRINITY_DN5857_c0_g1_i1:788-1360(-)